MQFYDLKAIKDSRIQDLFDEFLRDRKSQKPDFFKAALETAANKIEIGRGGKYFCRGAPNIAKNKQGGVAHEPVAEGKPLF